MTRDDQSGPGNASSSAEHAAGAAAAGSPPPPLSPALVGAGVRSSSCSHGGTATDVACSPLPSTLCAGVGRSRASLASRRALSSRRGCAATLFVRWSCNFTRAALPARGAFWRCPLPSPPILSPLRRRLRRCPSCQPVHSARRPLLYSPVPS
ncbi:hypothetical protein T492DRAFT_381005, partial [Pavlovales sp. CCMP2436]